MPTPHAAALTDRRLTVEWQDPRPALRAGAGLSGLDALQRMVAGEFPPPPIAQLMGFRLVRVAPGEAVFECCPGEQHYNPLGTVHGGLAMTLLDSAMGCAIHTLRPPGSGYTTLEAKVNMVRAISAETGKIHCTGAVIHHGRSTATAEGRLVDAAGRLLAHGTTTCLLFEAPTAK